MYFMTKDIFGFASHDEDSQPGGRRSDTELFGFLEHLQRVGLGDNLGQRAFATAMWSILDDFVAGEWMKVDWERHQSQLKTLTRFISHGFMPFIKRSITLLGGMPDDVCQYQEIAVARLGMLRIANLFDYIVRWNDSLGAVRDIKEYVSTPEARLFLTKSFSDQLQRRLLHAGATTTHILNLYINIIHAFNELDSKGVLLDRVARPIRRYLRQREDTARIIVTSLLADLDEEGRPLADVGADISIEIAKEMAKPIIGLDADEDYDMDWDNMEWTPDPIDVSADFKRSKNQDVTSALLSLYDREDFINELKTILGEHLLRNYDVHEHFEKEERLLELFKNRLGEDKLQACEVMLRDVQSSHQMNKTIHRFPAYLDITKEVGHIDLNTHILSSFFWPSLRDDDFKIPAPVQALQKNYEEGFEAVKDMRKLRWLTALGRVTVELEFEDRQVEEEVPTWTASIIYAFQSEGVGAPPSKSVEQLSEELEMDETLVRNAITFWRSKQVLQETSSDTFTVIENLSSLEQAGGAAPTAPVLMEEDAAVSAVKSQQDLLNDNADLYRSFITGMLTNQGSLPLMRIFMMLKIVVPGGFPLGLEEVKALLQGLVDEGKVIGQGDVYGMKRD
jgi:anaphase-promoting complex subunit 2